MARMRQSPIKRSERRGCRKCVIAAVLWSVKSRFDDSHAFENVSRLRLPSDQVDQSS